MVSRRDQFKVGPPPDWPPLVFHPSFHNERSLSFNNRVLSAQSTPPCDLTKSLFGLC